MRVVQIQGWGEEGAKAGWGGGGGGGGVGKGGAGVPGVVIKTPPPL